GRKPSPRSMPTAPGRSSCASASQTRARCERNPAYWGPIDSNVTRVEWRPIGNDPTRVSALISGDLDIVIDVPTQDVARLTSAPNLKVERTDEFRTIFFGFDLKNDQL